MVRVYVPATISMLQTLVADRAVAAVNRTAFALTPGLREAYSTGDDDELAEVAMAEAARAALRLIAAEADADNSTAEADADNSTAEADADNSTEEDDSGEKPAPVFRRAVIAADVDGAELRPDLDDAVVRLAGPIEYRQIASVHVDLAEAEDAVAKAVRVVDAADLGDTDAEFVLGDAEDHELAWYAAQELPFLIELL
ncbi:hypothetical protein OG921_15390 [Aldersonia sp. NBC_00410]|uniref:DUF6912 family protein n=1 Tax=Aldersonia sp. NBC_00410 TaxID=2975954 RepID=UPI00224CB365|nr:hypothetical protein [Aldersonia sp. NBC_00410]MCX5044554.1 hypothetical protein [Aldersonia sp. NBC_00410]